MTLAPDTSVPQHLVLNHVTWADYERTLEQFGNSSTRVTYCDGRMEIMSPLPDHEMVKKAIARLIEMLAFELDLPLFPLGSTTFRRDDQDAGLEPDECYYVGHEKEAREMHRFDPAVHPAPDLAIEIDVTHRSIAREPIYARLGVKEVWRYRDSRISVRLLAQDGQYFDSATSPLFPFLHMEQVETFVRRMISESQNRVLRDFQEWLRSLPLTEPRP